MLAIFIAAFVAGLAVQVGFKEAGKHSVEFTEEWGQLLNLSVFFIFGLLVARDSVHPRVDGKSAGLPSRVLAKPNSWNKMWWSKVVALGRKN